MNKKVALMLGAGVGTAVAFTAVGLWAINQGEDGSQTQVLWQDVPENEQSCISRILQQRGIDTALLGAMHAIRPDDPLILPFRQQCQNQPVVTPAAISCDLDSSKGPVACQPKWDDITPNGPR